MEWISLFDDMGIFYLCEPIGAIRRVLRKLRIGRVDRQRGGGSCLGSESSRSSRGSRSSRSSKDTWERDTVSWISSLVSEMRSCRRSGSNGNRESRKHSVNGRRSRESGRQSARDEMKNKRTAESISGIGSGIESESKNGNISGIGIGSESKNGSVSGIGSGGRNASKSVIGSRNKNKGGSITASERISGTNRRRNERAASSIAASHIGQSLKGIPRENVF